MGNSSSALPYSVGAEERPARYRNHHTGWALHSGAATKSGGGEVSVFKFSRRENAARSETPLDAEVRAAAARHHARRIRTLVHPHLLRAVATLDTDDPEGTTSSSSSLPENAAGDVIVVTEKVVPLEDYLRGTTTDGERRDVVAWGLVCVVEALHFLHSVAKSCHGRVCVDSIYVTPGGDFRLGELGLLTGIEGGGAPLPRSFVDAQSVLVPPSCAGPERAEGRWDAVAACPPHAMDSYSLGALVRDLYDDDPPTKLVKAVQRLTTTNLKLRPRLAPLLKCPALADNPSVKINAFLDNIAAAPAEEKLAFLQSLPDKLQRGTVHARMAKHKVLRELVRICESTVGGAGGGNGGAATGAPSPSALQQDVTRREILAVIPPLHIITNMILPPKEDTDKDDSASAPTTPPPPLFTNTIVPLLTSLFTLNDRGIRGALLSRFVPVLADNLDAHTLNTAVFEPACSGFTDSSPALRELTLKSSLHLVPHLTSSSLDKLCRYLIRLQSDPEPAVRTNTVIFVGRISPRLSAKQRETLLLPAFTRAMADDFAPCRLAALRSVSSRSFDDDPRAVAKRVLPAVAPHTVDPAREVRTEALAVVDALVATLRAESDRMTRAENDRAAATDGRTATDAGGGTDATSTEETSSSSSYFSGLSSWAMGSGKTPAPAPAPAPARVAPPPRPPPAPAAPIEDDDLDDDDDDGWSDDGVGDLGGADDDDDADAWKDADPTPAASRLTAAEDEDALFASAFEQTTTKVATKLVINRPRPTTQKTTLSLAERKAEFERRKLDRMEKRLQQQRERQGATTTSRNGYSSYRGGGAGTRDDGWTDFSR